MNYNNPYANQNQNQSCQPTRSNPNERILNSLVDAILPGNQQYPPYGPGQYPPYGPGPNQPPFGPGPNQPPFGPGPNQPPFPPGPGPQPGPNNQGQGQMPKSPPPNFTPQEPQQQSKSGATLYAVDPQTMYGCLYRYTYVWTYGFWNNGFWFYPTYVGRRSVSGYKWTGWNWVYTGLDTRQIKTFQCY